MRPALVVGGTGFLGRHVVQALVARGTEVRVTLRPERPERRARDLGPGVTVVRASLDDPGSLLRAADGCDTVYFAAGHYPRWSLDPETEVEAARAGARAVLEAARAACVRRVIVTSSTATIGRALEGRLADEDDRWPAPPVNSVYHAVKLAIEAEAERAIAAGLPAVIVCPGGCVGAHDARAGTGFFLVALAKRKLHYWIDGPLNIVDVAAVGEAHVRAAEVGRVGARYILGGVNTTVPALLATSAEVLGVPFDGRRLPVGIAAVWSTRDEMLAASTGRPRRFFAREFVDMLRLGVPVDSSRATRELDLRATDLPATLERARRWFEEHRYIPRRGRTPAPAVEENHVV
jgi:dihydroflavonol-4-reductase